MANLISPDAGDITRTVPAHAVWTRSQWLDGWTAQPSLFVDDVFWGSGPLQSTARLWWSYGEEIKPGGTAFQTYSAKDLLGQYVKIQISQPAGDDPLYWYGVLTDEDDRRGGALMAGGANPPRILIGEQRLQAVGLDYLLQRTIVNTSVIRDETDGALTTIQRGLTFNAENSYANVGNRSPEVGPDGVYLFAKDLDNASYWTTLDILQYLLFIHSPRDLLGVGRMDWSLSAGTWHLAPDWDRPVIVADARDVRSIISQLLDPRRLMSWSLSVNPAPETILLNLFCFNSEALVLPGGGIQQPNASILSIDFDRALDVTATLRKSETNKLEQVRIQGARKRSIVTLAYNDGTLEKDWTNADEEAYEAGVADIGELDIAEQERRIGPFRSKERFERVYRYFRLPATFNRFVGDGLGGTELYFPNDPVYGAEHLYVPELRFEHFLPRALIETAKDGSPEVEIPPFGVIKIEIDGAVNRYEFLSKLSTYHGAEGYGEGNGRQWACSFRMQPKAPGVIVKVNGGSVGQEAIAATDFAASATRDKAGELDWQDMHITLMLELEARVEARYPPFFVDPGLGQDAARLLIVGYGDKYRLDYVPGGTVLGHEDGELVYWGRGAGSYLRDDREALEDLARFVYEWYGTERQAFSLGLKQVYGGLSVGDLITSIGAAETLESVNSAVTGVRINMKSATTQITTMFPALDFKNL